MKLKKSIFSKIISSVSLISVPIIFTSSKCTTSHKNDKVHQKDHFPVELPQTLFNELMYIGVRLKNNNWTIKQVTIKDLEFYNYNSSLVRVFEPKIEIFENDGYVNVTFRLQEIKTNEISQAITLSVNVPNPTIEQALENVKVEISQKLFIEKIEGTDLRFKNLHNKFTIAYAKVEHQKKDNKVKVTFAIIDPKTDETSKEKVVYLDYNEFAIPQDSLDQIASDIKVILKNENIDIEELLKLPFDQAITLFNVHKRVKVIDKSITKAQRKNYIKVSFKIKDLYGSSVSNIDKELRVNNKNSGSLFGF